MADFHVLLLEGAQARTLHILSYAWYEHPISETQHGLVMVIIPKIAHSVHGAQELINKGFEVQTITLILASKSWK